VFRDERKLASFDRSDMIVQLLQLQEMLFSYMRKHYLANNIALLYEWLCQFTGV